MCETDKLLDVTRLTQRIMILKTRRDSVMNVDSGKWEGGFRKPGAFVPCKTFNLI